MSRNGTGEKSHSLLSARPVSGAALLITLLMLSLITIIAVAFLGTMTWELSGARNNYESQKARALAMVGLNTAVAQLRNALGAWDNPYQNFATTPPAFFWSISPGIISRWSYNSPTPSNYPLFSTDPSGANNLVNLNAPQSDGSCPIAGITNPAIAGATPPNISVYWTPVLKNPGNATASASNPIIGRYAFWVDDENAKININTADGTMKYKTNSLGLGSPSEVSLQALQQGGNALAHDITTNIVYLARTAGLNSPKEILRAAGTTPDLYTNNVFNLTAYSRSPELNIFGQSRMSMTPLLGDSDWWASDVTINSITLQPAREIYPTPSQLPQYSVLSPIDPNQYWTWYPSPPNSTVQMRSYPLAFRGEFGSLNMGAYSSIASGDCNQRYILNNNPWINGLMLAKYLDGFNAAGQPIAWPTFAGASSSGFVGKYTLRQLDSIVAQITSLGSKEISPDINYGTNPDANVGGNRGLSTFTVPFLFNGWLSRQWVSGMGRVPKVDSIELKLVTYGAVGAPTDTKNYYPSTSLDVWLEWWLPAAYLGGKGDITVAYGYGYNGQLTIGQRQDQRVLNVADLCENTEWIGTAPSPPTYYLPGAALPRADYVGTNYWGNQLLVNDQGIDFQCNPSNVNGSPLNDPDQTMAAQYHNPFSLQTNNVTYSGAGPFLGNGIYFDTPFAMVSPQTPATGSASWKDWAPGEVRCVRSYNGSIMPSMPMQITTGPNPTLNISGGIQVRSELNSGIPSDPDPVPLESIRGTSNPSSAGGTSTDTTGEKWTDPATPGSSMKLRDRFMQEVIPIQLSMAVPGPNSDPSGITKYALIKVADPLVNKFPGDWTTAGGATVTYSDSAPTVPSYWAGATADAAGVATNSEYNLASGSTGSNFHAQLADPDSYWLPQADVPVCDMNDVASETLIPRSARFPNLGYLQYVRTGIMPDVETPNQPGLEHGTPFRLLSYGPLSDGSQTVQSGTYPDWALLDLLYVPSFLASYGSPYGYYQTNSVWQGFGNPGVLANFSTGGGSTPGRVNPNGVVIYTTNATIPQPGIARTVPLQAVVHGLMVKQSLVPTTDPYNNPTPGFIGGTSVDDSISESDGNSIPVAIENYIRTKGPLRMPGELCNVPEIAALRPSVNVTRNDLIRQIVGNLTTQSNTFSVWVAGQSIVKSKVNSNYGAYESGDQVSAAVRYHFIVERYLDPGADGVYGNSVNGGADGVAGTYDDPVDPINHPFEPRYLYRVVSAEEIR